MDINNLKTIADFESSNVPTRLYKHKTKDDYYITSLGQEIRGCEKGRAMPTAGCANAIIARGKINEI